jgi:glycosyltransferase involved in cell wall biosynthesis
MTLSQDNISSTSHSIDAGAGESPRVCVLQVVPRLETGGAERSAVDVALAVQEAGGKSLVASEGGPMARELQRAGVEHITLPLAAKNPLTLRKNRASLVELIRAQGIHILHARSRAPAWSAWYACQETGCSFVTTFHGTYNFKSGLKRRYNAIMTRGARVIANSDFIARHIRDNYKIDPERLRVIHRGIDLSKFDPERVSAERVIQLANRWRLPDGMPVILLPGRLTRWKGQTLFLVALAKIKERDFLAILVGADQGRTAYRAEVEKLVKTQGLENRVYLAGHCDDMAAAYKLADVVVSASIEPEAFGRITSEGQAMGRPVVAPAHGGAPEQVIPDLTAFLFKPRDAASLAEALIKALELDTREREHLALQAMTHARTTFSKARMCQATLAVYNEVLAESAAARGEVSLRFALD